MREREADWQSGVESLVVLVWVECVMNMDKGNYGKSTESRWREGKDGMERERRSDWHIHQVYDSVTSVSLCGIRSGCGKKNKEKNMHTQSRRRDYEMSEKRKKK